MIVFHIIPFTLKTNINTQRSIKADRRVKYNRKVTKNNKSFLKALGFKI